MNNHIGNPPFFETSHPLVRLIPMMRRNRLRPWRKKSYITYKLEEPIVWVAKSGIKIEVPVGFVSDGTSIPSIFHGPPFFIAKEGAHTRAALLHDWLYSIMGRGKFPREWCDRQFYDALRVLGVNEHLATLLHTGVRIGGWIAWRDNLNKEPQTGLVTSGGA